MEVRTKTAAAVDENSLEYIRWRDEIEFKKIIEGLRQKNVDVAMYLALIAQGTLMRPTRNVQLRGFVLDMYGDYFRYGVNRKSQNWFRKQEMFLSFSCDSSFRLAGLTDVGYKCLLQQLEMFTTIYDQFMLKNFSVERLAADIFRFSITVSHVITHRCIQTLFPHMLLEHEFMEQVVGKEMEYEGYVTVIFGSNNKMLEFQTEAQVIQGWFKILKDPVVLQRTLQQSFINSGGLITNRLETYS